MDEATAALYIAYGAHFVVGPVLNERIARLCNRRKVAYIPGCGSPSEISEAEELGVEIVKVFPGDSVGGPEFVKAVLAPCPWTRIMPSGGVEATQASITAWFKAGAAAVNIGSNLIRKDLIQAGDYDAVASATARVLGWIRDARGEGLFRGIEHPGLYPYGGATAKDIATWYAEVFGLKLSEGNASFFLGGSGPGRLEVMKAGDTDRSHVAVQVADFDAAVALLQTKGIEVEQPTISADLKVVYLKPAEPAGNRVHLVWRR